MSNIQQIEEQIDKIQNNNMKLFEIFQTVMELPENKNPETLKVTPTKEYQEHRGLYNVVLVDGDADLKPENIKEGIEIFGVEGTAKTTDAKITDTGYLFYYGHRLDNMDKLLALCENVTDMSYMFYNCETLTELDLSDFNTSNVTNMKYTFYSCNGLKELDLSSFDTSNVTDMYGMFNGCNKLTLLDLSNFNTSNVTTMANMFSSCNDAESIDVSSFDTSNVKSMYQMFSSCQDIISLDLSHFDTSNVTDMESMFYNNTQLKSLDLSNFNTSNVKTMNNMFYGCGDLAKLDLSSFDTSNIKSMNQLFYNCRSLMRLDIRNFTFDNVTSYNNPFVNVPANCLIAVKGNTEKEWVLARRSDLTNVKTLDELHLKSIEINAEDIDMYGGNKNGQVYITYDGGKDTSFYPEEMNCTFTIVGNATIDDNGVITLTDNVQVGDKLIITAVSTYDNSITATIEISTFITAPGYTVDLNNGEWVDSGEIIDGNVVYKSNANSYHISSGKSIATITTVDIKNLKLYIRSYAESGYDYTEAFAVDTDAVRSKGLYTTKDKSSATDYIECNYELDEGMHTIQIMYSKDGSSNKNDDRGYFYIGEYTLY